MITAREGVETEPLKNGGFVFSTRTSHEAAEVVRELEPLFHQGAFSQLALEPYESRMNPEHHFRVIALPHEDRRTP